MIAVRPVEAAERLRPIRFDTPDFSSDAKGLSRAFYIFTPPAISRKCSPEWKAASWQDPPWTLAR